MPIRVLRLFTMELFDRGAVIEDILWRLTQATGIRALLTHNTVRDAPHIGLIKDSMVKQIQRQVRLIGRYAVLSHTWIVNRPGEVTYEDTRTAGWQNSEMLRVSKPDGLRKLDSFCTVAREAPYFETYGWMDTVCIDKSSTAELDESIRSMYRWYTNAAVCIVHLAETWGSENLSGMEGDRWFTRGWTLQEYLAPKVVKFHDRHWKSLTSFLQVHEQDELDNDKFPGRPPNQPTLIQQKIEQATGIPSFIGLSSTGTDADSDALPSGGRIAKQMQWASRRMTTRQEDAAYALMGIFGVSIPIAYGEGAARAFFRLVAAILESKPADQVGELLTWGGLPVSDKIHTSRLLPSSPKCYCIEEEDGTRDETKNAAWIIAGQVLPPEPTMLTHIGLRVRVVLCPVALAPQDPSHLPHQFDGHHVKFTMRPSMLRFKALEVDLLASHAAYPRPGQIFPLPPSSSVQLLRATGTQNSPLQTPHFVFAMYTFIDEGVLVRIPRSGLGFLLGWYPPTNKQWLKDGDLASAYFNAYSKIDTRRAVTFARNVNSVDGYTNVAKGSQMEGENLALVSLYL